MMSAGAVRTVTMVVCGLGIAGMIVTSILNHNGAAVTFGLVTAVAVLCSMVAKAVAAEAERRMGGQGDGDPSDETARTVPADALAEVVEDQLQAIVAAGADEAAMRQLVGEAVRLGRRLADARPVESDPQ